MLVESQEIHFFFLDGNRRELNSCDINDYDVSRFVTEATIVLVSCA